MTDSKTMTSDDLVDEWERTRVSSNPTEYILVGDRLAARIRELEAELEELRGFYGKHSITEHMIEAGTHVIVPVEPTPEMLEASYKAGSWNGEIYRAMIRAAQEKADETI